MNKRFLACCAVSFALLFALLDFEVTAAEKGMGLNVKDFGAKGDGVTDDTEALQKLFSSVYNTYMTMFVKYESSYPEIVFPEGTYLISKTLVLSNWVNVRGIGNVVIKQTNPDKDIIYIHWAFRNLIENITFEGGRRQLKLWTANSDSARVFIKDCKFRNSSSYAVECIMKGKSQKEMFVPYRIKTVNGLPELTDRDESSHPYWFNSTLIHITRCDFKNCIGVLYSNADGCNMDNCTIETHPDMKGAAIYNASLMKLENITGLAHVTEGNNQRWIDNYHYGLICRNLKLKTDSDKGICAIYNLYKCKSAWKGVHMYIIADGCEFQSAGCKENSLIYCKEVPNLIYVRNCRELSGKDVPILGFDDVPDAEYFTKTVGAEGLAFVLDNNNENLIPNLPLSMKPYEDKPLPDEVTKLFEKKKMPVDDISMKSFIRETINAADFGAKGDNKADSTAAIQRAFNEAARRKGCEVAFPYGVYKISDTIKLPAEVSVRSDGCAVFIGENESRTMFRAADVKHLSFSNCTFWRGKTTFSIKTNPETEAKIFFDNCLFKEAQGPALEVLSGKGAPAEKNGTLLRVTNSSFILSRQALVTNAAYAVIDNTWITTDQKMKNSAAIVNRGTLRLENILGVPLVENKNDQRWIDNYFRVICDNVRFGGEGAGFCMVVNKRSYTKEKKYVLIENGWTYVGGNPKRQAMVYCEEIPDVIALRSNVGFEPGKQKMVFLARYARGTLKGRFFESGNTAPAATNR